MKGSNILEEKYGNSIGDCMIVGNFAESFALAAAAAFGAQRYGKLKQLIMISMLFCVFSRFIFCVRSTRYTRAH
ncbi:MAG: hypothetical protein PUE72_05490 [Lachnospiraceae bacterium]|nr:hypothetical protein [Lachnospiraceae bacterium]